MRALSPVFAAASALFVSGPLRAFDAGKIAGDPVAVELTESASIIANADNRNQRARDVPSHLDDDWWLAYNRLHARAAWRDFSLSLRLDSAWFPSTRTATGVALELTRERAGVTDDADLTAADRPFFQNKLLEAGQELSTRYVSYTYPAKYALEYRSPSYEITVGDFHAQLGRGLVLSVRQRDELSDDTTLRGVRGVAKVEHDEVRLELVGLFGTANPLRIDEASGRYLAVDGSVTPGVTAITEAGMPRTVATDLVPSPDPSFAPDRVVGARLSVADSGVRAGVQGSLLLRDQPLTPDVVRGSRQIRTASASFELPDLWRHGTVYVEAAKQELADPFGTGEDLSGNALYTSATLEVAPVSVTFEGRRYRSFFPLRANVDLSRAPEFSSVQLSAPPTAEPVWNDAEFEEFNTCVTGGRGQVDFTLSRGTSVSAWLGRHDTWAELGSNERCQTTPDRLNRVWDFAGGTELFDRERRSRVEVIVGARFDDARAKLAGIEGPTHVFYREEYVRFEASHWIEGPFSVELQGWHRRRRQTLGGPRAAWHTGQTLTSLTWAGQGLLGVGFEYDTNPALPPTYVNGQLRYDIDRSSNVALFVGQRLGGLRCTSGVCRVFPPFAGARLDATVTF